MKKRADRRPPIQSGTIVHGCAAGIPGILTMPPGASAIVLLAYASETGRPGRESRMVAKALNRRGPATLLFDLLAPGEQALEFETLRPQFDIDLLGDRLVTAIEWVGAIRSTRRMRLGLFGSGTGAAAVLVAATNRPAAVKAVLSRNGRSDHAGEALAMVKAPTLLSFSGSRHTVILLNGNSMKPGLEIPPQSGRQSSRIPVDVRRLGVRGGSGFVRTLAAVVCPTTTTLATGFSGDHDPIEAEPRLACRRFREKLTASANRSRSERALANLAQHEEGPYRR